MGILFDHSTPAPLRRFLAEHTVVEALERGWHNLTNGDLLKCRRGRRVRGADHRG
jgi:hypothetical protein